MVWCIYSFVEEAKLEKQKKLASDNSEAKNANEEDTAENTEKTDEKD